MSGEERQRILRRAGENEPAEAEKQEGARASREQANAEEARRDAEDDATEPTPRSRVRRRASAPAPLAPEQRGDEGLLLRLEERAPARLAFDEDPSLRLDRRTRRRPGDLLS